MYTVEEIKIANATSRTNGASAKNKDNSIRAIVPKYVAENADKNVTILDYGAGKDAAHTLWLRNLGFDVVAYDFGDNTKEGLHDKNALNRQYKTIFASNVINVQSSFKMLVDTLVQIYNSLESGGTFIMNYPTQPRKLDLCTDSLKEIIHAVFEVRPEKVGGTKNAPIWKINKI